MEGHTVLLGSCQIVISLQPLCEMVSALSICVTAGALPSVTHNIPHMFTGIISNFAIGVSPQSRH